ncbi:MAG: hypothetical protein VX951_00470 [Planctomycetota bacterium]|nr:hypothetical protein [Planctomycetota bacterium]
MACDPVPLPNTVEGTVRHVIDGLARDLDLKPSSAYLKILDEVLMDLEKLEETQSRPQFERLLMEPITKYKKLLESPR